MIGRGRDLSLPRNQMELKVKAHAPVRLDLYLREALAWRSRKRIQELIRSGRILVNGKRVKPSQAVRGGDLIRIELSMGTGVPGDYLQRDIHIIYEDEWIVAIDKPAGLLVHPVGRHVYDTLMNYLHYRHRGGEAAGIPLRLCHRIDRDTTGIVLVAKDSFVHREVQWQFENRKVSKKYLALATGRIPLKMDEISLPIGEGKNLEGALTPPLRPTRTGLSILEHFSGSRGEFTLVQARPVTGRQNQIRVHLAAMGHAIAGDSRYGGPRIESFPSRHLLHARSLRFYHPRFKSQMEVSAPLPADFQKVIEELGGKRKKSGSGTGTGSFRE